MHITAAALLLGSFRSINGNNKCLRLAALQVYVCCDERGLIVSFHEAPCCPAFSGTLPCFVCIHNTCKCSDTHTIENLSIPVIS